MGVDSPKPSEPYLSTDHLTLDLAAHAASSAAVTMVSQGLRFLITMTGTVVLARLLNPQDYGLIGMAGTVMGFIALFKDLGLDAATIQHSLLHQRQPRCRDHAADSRHRSGCGVVLRRTSLESHNHCVRRWVLSQRI